MSETKKPFRCTKCKKLLFEALINDAVIEIKCKCGEKNKIVVQPQIEPEKVFHGVIRQIPE